MRCCAVQAPIEFTDGVGEDPQLYVHARQTLHTTPRADCQDPQCKCCTLDPGPTCARRVLKVTKAVGRMRSGSARQAACCALMWGSSARMCSTKKSSASWRWGLAP